MAMPLDLQSYALPQIAPESDDLINALIARKRKKVRIRLSQDEQRSLAVRIVQDFFDAAATNQAFRDNHVEFMNNWRGTPVPNDKGPLGEQSANVKVPLTSTFVEQWKSRLMKIILGDGEMVKFYSLIEPLQEEQLVEIGKWFSWELTNIIKFPDKLNAILHYILIDGIALPIPYYDRVVERKCFVKEFELIVEAQVSTQIEAAINQTFSQMGLLVSQVLADEKVLGAYEVYFKDADDPAYVVALVEDETLVLEVEADLVTFDGVKIELPNIEDVIIINTAENVEDIPFFGIRSWLTATEIDCLRERGEFDITQAEFENVIAFASAKISDFIPQETTQEFDVVEGADSLGTAYVRGNDYERRWVEIYRWEGWVWYKGKRQSMAVWLAPRSYTILRIVLLEELNKDGLRSPVKHDFIPVPGRFYSVGLCEWLRNTQTEMDGIHNFRLNSALISTVPFGFFSPLAGMPQSIMELRAGQLYPVKDPKSVYFPPISWSPVWGFQEEGLVRKYASELAGMGDPGVGTYTSKRTSATEFMGTAQAIDIRTEYIATTILRSVEELLSRIFGLYQQHAKGERIFQLGGPNEKDIVKSLSMDRIQGRLKLQLTGNVRQLSKELERQTSMNMLSIILNPFMLQLGIVKPDTIYAATKKLFTTSDYKGVPIHQPDVPPDSPTPLDEWKMMQGGIYVEPHMGEDFGRHLQAHIQTASRPDLLEMSSPEAAQMLQRHIMETQQMYQQVIMIREAQAAMATQQQGQMAKQGVRPGEEGNTQSEPGKPGTQEEGVESAESPGGEV